MQWIIMLKVIEAGPEIANLTENMIVQNQDYELVKLTGK